MLQCQHYDAEWPSVSGSERVPEVRSGHDGHHVLPAELGVAYPRAYRERGWLQAQGRDLEKSRHIDRAHRNLPRSGIHRVVRSRFLAGHTPAQAGGGHVRKCRRPVRGPSRSPSTVVIGRSSKLGGSRRHPKIPRLHHCSVSIPHDPLPLLAVLRSADPEPRTGKRGAQQWLPYGLARSDSRFCSRQMGRAAARRRSSRASPSRSSSARWWALENRVGRLPAASSQSALSGWVMRSRGELPP